MAQCVHPIKNWSKKIHSIVISTRNATELAKKMLRRRHFMRLILWISWYALGAIWSRIDEKTQSQWLQQNLRRAQASFQTGLIPYIALVRWSRFTALVPVPYNIMSDFQPHQHLFKERKITQLIWQPALWSDSGWRGQIPHCFKRWKGMQTPKRVELQVWRQSRGSKSFPSGWTRLWACSHTLTQLTRMHKAEAHDSTAEITTAKWHWGRSVHRGTLA